MALHPIAPASLEEGRRIGDWWSRQEYLYEFMATPDRVFAYELMRARYPTTWHRFSRWSAQAARPIPEIDL